MRGKVEYSAFLLPDPAAFLRGKVQKNALARRDAICNCDRVMLALWPLRRSGSGCVTRESSLPLWMTDRSGQNRNFSCSLLRNIRCDDIGKVEYSMERDNFQVVMTSYYICSFGSNRGVKVDVGGRPFHFGFYKQVKPRFTTTSRAIFFLKKSLIH